MLSEHFGAVKRLSIAEGIFESPFWFCTQFISGMPSITHLSRIVTEVDMYQPCSLIKRMPSNELPFGAERSRCQEFSFAIHQSLSLRCNAILVLSFMVDLSVGRDDGSQ